MRAKKAFLGLSCGEEGERGDLDDLGVEVYTVAAFGTCK